MTTSTIPSFVTSPIAGDDISFDVAKDHRIDISEVVNVFLIMKFVESLHTGIHIVINKRLQKKKKLILYFKVNPSKK
jgi:hypothetical protein